MVYFLMVSKGEIWLVNLNPMKKNNEMGKVRPVVVYQNNELNHSDYPTTIVISLSSHLVDDSQPIRYRLLKRDNLKKDSDVVITQIRAIDNDRFIEKLGHLTKNELAEIKILFDEIIQQHDKSLGRKTLSNYSKIDNSEFAKVRPALIIQNDVANRNIDKVDFKGVTVIPMSTNIFCGDLRVQMQKKDKLKQHIQRVLKG